MATFDVTGTWPVNVGSSNVTSCEAIFRNGVTAVSFDWADLHEAFSRSAEWKLVRQLERLFLISLMGVAFWRLVLPVLVVWRPPKLWEVKPSSGTGGTA